jgi:putative ABC transport system ATP-binding protein
MGSPIIEANEISVVTHERPILESVSLSVDRDESLLIEGKSGAGKTTLFNVLGLLEPPTGGTLRIDGDDVTALGERARAKLRRETIGYVFQEFHLVPDLTAYENAAMPQEHAGSRDEEWLDTLFTTLGIADRTDAYPATLSGGEKQRLAIARALANRPQVVLADEPTGQLDADTAGAVLEVLVDLQRETEAALVVVSHDQWLIERFPTRKRLVDGRLVDD